MPVIRVSPRLTVSGQPEPGSFAGLAAQGFRAIINSRPDGEADGQPPRAAMMAEARQAGLDYVWIPVRPGMITEADVDAFAAALDAADGPVFAHCASATRSLSLHVLGEVLADRMQRQAVEPLGREHGIDLSGAGRWLDRRAAALPLVKGFHDERTGSIQYVVTDPATRRCAIIDPVHDFDEKSGCTATRNADAILDYVGREGLTVQWILDTHPHADHFSAARYLKAKTGAPTAIGAHVTRVQKLWQDIYSWPELATDGSQWDRLFADGDRFRIGNLEARVMHSPGHTLASVTYVIGDAAFIHDTLFMPDSGSARADFPGGSAKSLWHSIEAIMALPDETRLFTGHDYRQGGRHARWESTVAAQRRDNPHVAGRSEADYVALREARDSTLPMPELILHALQVNVNGGRLPEPEADGRRYLKFPLDALKAAVW